MISDRKDMNRPSVIRSAITNRPCSNQSMFFYAEAYSESSSFLFLTKVTLFAGCKYIIQ